MPRANRHYIPGCAWHITHRCHQGEFLLKFVKDRKRWKYWLFEAKKRYGLCVLNYIVTSNHIHLLVVDTGKDIVSRSMQLIAGRTAQEYNIRKNRKGAFWEDRYHATAVESGTHLAQCMVYIDLNMVRAGVVEHPENYSVSGYHEIQNPLSRYSILHSDMLLNYLGMKDMPQLQQEHLNWIKVTLATSDLKRDSLWSGSVAVGSLAFVEKIQSKLSGQVLGRKLIQKDKFSVLMEPEPSYS